MNRPPKHSPALSVVQSDVTKSRWLIANAVTRTVSREILGSDCPKSDAEMEKLRDQLYGLAQVVVEALPKKPRKNILLRKPECFADAVLLLPENERYELEERAGIMEFDGGLDRSAAERAAFSQFWREKHRRKSR